MQICLIFPRDIFQLGIFFDQFQVYFFFSNVICNNWAKGEVGGETKPYYDCMLHFSILPLI